MPKDQITLVEFVEGVFLLSRKTKKRRKLFDLVLTAKIQRPVHNETWKSLAAAAAASERCYLPTVACNKEANFIVFLLSSKEEEEERTATKVTIKY